MKRRGLEVIGGFAKQTDSLIQLFLHTLGFPMNFDLNLEALLRVSGLVLFGVLHRERDAARSDL